VISQDGHCGYPQPNDGIEQRFHFGWLAIIGEIPGKNQHICFISHLVELIAQNGLA
jgi:hypothetical protein